MRKKIAFLFLFIFFFTLQGNAFVLKLDQPEEEKQKDVLLEKIKKMSQKFSLSAFDLCVPPTESYICKRGLRGYFKTEVSGMVASEVLARSGFISPSYLKCYCTFPFDLKNIGFITATGELCYLADGAKVCGVISPAVIISDKDLYTKRVLPQCYKIIQTEPNGLTYIFSLSYPQSVDYILVSFKDFSVNIKVDDFNDDFAITSAKLPFLSLSRTELKRLAKIDYNVLIRLLNDYINAVCEVEKRSNKNFPGKVKTAVDIVARLLLGNKKQWSDFLFFIKKRK